MKLNNTNGLMGHPIDGGHRKPLPLEFERAFTNQPPSSYVTAAAA